jgi:alpha-tubulin suppressor-like RCC1 family protein
MKRTLIAGITFIVAVACLAFPVNFAEATGLQLTVFASSLPTAGGLVTATYVVPSNAILPVPLASCSLVATDSSGATVSVPTCDHRVGTHEAVFLVPPNTKSSTNSVTLTYSTSSKSNVITSISKSISVSPAAAHTYVALGDSFSSGEGNPTGGWSGWVDYNGTSDNTRTANDHCDRSPTAYSERVKTSLAHTAALKLTGLSFSFLACSGATTSDLYASSPSLGIGLVGASGDNGESIQLNDRAELANARIVTLSVGGNDIYFSSIIEACVAASLGQTVKGLALASIVASNFGISPTAFFGYGSGVCSPSSPISAVSNVFSHITTLKTSLVATYRQVQLEAPHAAIYVVGYPDLLPPTPTTAQLAHGCGSISGSFLPFLSGIEPALNDVIKQAATSTGLTYVNPNSGSYSFAPKVPGGIGDHTLCSSSPWIHAINTQHLPQSLVGSYHPDITGQAELALSVEAAVTKDHAPSMAPALKGVKSIANDSSSYCALLISGGVDCWGTGNDGQLGDGAYSKSAIPVAVVSTSGSGFLTGVASLTSGGDGYCALLISGGVDCWGRGDSGELGNGGFSNSAIPVAVVSISGSGFLTGFVSLTSGGDGYCALLISGGVDCWGRGTNGKLGNGISYNDTSFGSAIPVAVVSTSGSGLLTGVAFLTSSGYGYSALLTSGSVDYWGDVYISNGSSAESAIPIAVVSATGSGLLTGVATFTSGNDGYCALLTSGSVDCWGNGTLGELGNGYYASSAIPIPVVSTSGAGPLTGVASLAFDHYNGYCALLTSGQVDCWGFGFFGHLGNGTFASSTIPVEVVSTSGLGPLTGVAVLASHDNGYCALFTSGSVDCWGYGPNGELGNGSYSDSAKPVAVVLPSGSGILSGIVSVTSGASSGYCALLNSGGVDCWGNGVQGALGDNLYLNSDIPTAVV